jgi:hypothetical protein
MRARKPRPIDEFDADTANKERTHMLRQNALRRKARGRGLELRHSAYGYSLVNSSRARVDGRNDLTLDEVEARLEAEQSEPGAKRSGRRI